MPLPEMMFRAAAVVPPIKLPPGPLKSSTPAHPLEIAAVPLGLHADVIPLNDVPARAGIVHDDALI